MPSTSDSPSRQATSERVSRAELLTIAVLLVLTLGLRLAGLEHFIANDEIRWTCRSIAFRDALRDRDWAGTFRVGHPGVVTTWLGAMFLPRDIAEAENSCHVSRGGMELDRVGSTPAEQTDRMAQLGRLLFEARLGVPLFTTLCIAVMYILMRVNFGPAVAVLGSSLIALDPFYLALSRVFHVDAVLASLMGISILGLLAGLHRSESRGRHLEFLFVSGIASGLALLQKSPAVFLAPWTALLLIAHAWRQGMSRETLTRAGRDLILWTAVVAVIYVAVWPAMWSNPMGTVRQVLQKAVDYAEEGHEPGNYFLGRAVQDPGWGYYPVTLAFRLSPVVLAGVIAAMIWLLRGRRGDRRRFQIAALLLYAILFTAFMTLGAKKFDRYLLPVYPALGVAAAVGLVQLIQAARRRLQRWRLPPMLIYSVISLVVLLTQLGLLLPHHPHYLTYYNPLMGGLDGAKEALVVGWGEGYERVAAYLNAKPRSEVLEAAVPTFAAFAPLFSGETRHVSDYSASQTDYVVFYLSQVQRQHDQSLMERYFSNPEVSPEHTVLLHGVEYAWIYPNMHYVEPLAYLQEHTEPEQNLLIVNRDSVFGKHYEGELQMRTFESRSSRQEVADLLDNPPGSVRRVWYPRYADSDPDGVTQLLRNRGLLVEQRDFPEIELVVYRLMEQPPMEDLDLRFGNLQLSAYGPTRPLPAWGRDGGVVLQWYSDTVLEHDYTAFVHVYDRTGHRIAQGDSPIINRDLLPTSEWQPGTSGSTIHHLSIPAGTPPGRYALRVGVYELKSGKRLPLLNSQGEEQGTSADLACHIGSSEEIPGPGDVTIDQRLERQLTPSLNLLAYQLPHRALPAGEAIPLKLLWQAADRPEQDYGLQLGLRDPAGSVIEQREQELVSTDYGTSKWRRGELIHEHYVLPTEESIPTGEVSIVVNLLDENGTPVLESPQEVASVWIQSLEPIFDVPGYVKHREALRVGDKISLVGYEVNREGGPRERLKATLYWRADARVERSYKVFVHVYDQEGHVVAQRDRMPGLGIHPTTSWEAEEVVADRYTMELSGELPPGTYSVAAGMYDAHTGQRLPIFRANGERLSEDRVFLGEFDVPQ